MTTAYLFSKAFQGNNSIKTLGVLKTFILVLALIISGGAVHAQYCVPENVYGCSEDDQYQTFITTGGVTNIDHEPGDSNCTGDEGGYASFSRPGLSCSGMHGNTIGFSILNNTAWAERYAIWVDWNQDNVFQASEQVFGTSGVLGADSTASGSFTIPANTPLGATILRIRCVYGTFGTSIDPCAAYPTGITFDFPFTVLNSPPVFAGGSPQPLMVCENGSADISSLLAVNDADSGQVEIWSTQTAPSHGTLIASYNTTSTGATLHPSGMSYTPDSGYSGQDSFSVLVTDALGATGSTTIYVTVNPTPSVASASIAAACAGSITTTLSYSRLTNGGTQRAIFSYSGAIQSWTVPAGVTNITMSASGAQGGGSSFGDSTSGGFGAIMSGSFVVTPGQVINILAGGQGALPGFGCGGGGGGSYIWDGVTNTLFIAAGGGGGAGNDFDLSLPIIGVDASTGTNGTNGVDATIGGGTLGSGGIVPDYSNHASGGAGWLSNGSNGTLFDCDFISRGGTIPLGGGAGGTGGGVAGSNANGGFGGGGGNNGRCINVGGGRGGGYSGGGAGGDNEGNQFYAGGGGGSFNGGTGQSNAVGNSGNGQIVINYTITPTTYNIVWDSAAHAAGFTDTVNGALPASPITVVVPGAAIPATYNGMLTISNTTCTSTGYPVSITINPIPSVDTVASQVLCNSATTTAVNFTGSAVPFTVYNWTNTDTTIGLSAAGSGNISPFDATNTTDSITNGVITVTPVANGCPGPVKSFTITVDPTPHVAATGNQTKCNGSPTAAIMFTGPVSGSSFSWANTNIHIGLGGSGLDSIPSFRATDDSTFPIAGSITVTASANGCIGTSNSFTIQVDPTPKLSSLLALPAICDSTALAYTPASATDGTSFTWMRNIISGISNPAATDTGSISETLVNNTTHIVSVTYAYALEANTCTDTQNVTVIVNPLPKLSTSLTPSSVCDSMPFIYGPASATSGTLFAWSRGSFIGISNAAATGMDTINETLVNTSTIPVIVVYVDTLKANGCSNIQDISVTVNPRPMLTTTTTAPSICDSTLFFYVPNSTIESTTFTWSRGVITGIGNPAASGGDTISEILINTTANPVNVVYVDSLTAYGCVYTQDVNVTVNPRPSLSSSLSPAGLCDSALFDYTPLSATTGAVFAWDRPFVLGIALDSASGTGNPDERLYNTSNSNLDVTYIYSITANGCSNTERVVVEVHPTPTLGSTLSETVCSGADFVYVPIDSGLVFGTSYAWIRSHVAGILPATNAGTGIINETLTDTALVPLATTYVFTLVANGCTHVQTLNVTVNPAPPVAEITTHSPGELCSNTLNQNFGTNTPPPAGQEYSWTAVNANIWAKGSGGQYVLVNFPSEGTAVITLKANITGISCITNSSYTVNVGSGVSDMPEVIYFNGQFMCLQNGENSYQWGYDDNITLDSTLIQGEMNQNYFISAPDLNHRNYWVITTENGCMQKSYYNTPTGITNINTDLTNIKVYPNPASNLINVDINTTVAGNIEVQVLNMLGQKLNTTAAIDHKAQINVNELPSGCYIIDCYREGIKIGAARFVKD